MELVTFRQGEVIFRQNDTENFMYAILAGTVGIYKDYGTERENKVAELEAGKFLGEMELVEAEPRSATAVALYGDVQLEQISDDNYLDFFEQNPVKVYLIMKQLSEHLRETTRNYAEACRTLDDTLRAAEAGREPDPELLERQRRFRGEYYASGAARQ